MQSDDRDWARYALGFGIKHLRTSYGPVKAIFFTGRKKRGKG